MPSAPLPALDRYSTNLGRYTHRVAISNHRILSLNNGRVTFSYRDRRDHNLKKQMSLDAQEFIRRFLLHVLPPGFMKIRHFGFLANPCKADNLNRIRRQLGERPLPDDPQPPAETVAEMMLRITGQDITRCPRCRQGHLVCVAELPPLPTCADLKALDTS